MDNVTPEPPKTEVEIETVVKTKTEVEGEDLSSTENKEDDQFKAQVAELLEFKKTMEQEKEKLTEQSLDLRVKETMTLFEGVENKADIEEHITTIAKCGGEDALTATKAILKSVMEGRILMDKKLTQRGGGDVNKFDELAIAEFGNNVEGMVSKIVERRPHPHVIEVKEGE